MLPGVGPFPPCLAWKPGPKTLRTIPLLIELVIYLEPCCRICYVGISGIIGYKKYQVLITHNQI
jgi:hypothetical protein